MLKGSGSWNHKMEYSTVQYDDHCISEIEIASARIMYW